MIVPQMIIAAESHNMFSNLLRDANKCECDSVDKSMIGKICGVIVPEGVNITVIKQLQNGASETCFENHTCHRVKCEEDNYSNTEISMLLNDCNIELSVSPNCCIRTFDRSKVANFIRCNVITSDRTQYTNDGRVSTFSVLMSSIALITAKNIAMTEAYNLSNTNSQQYPQSDLTLTSPQNGEVCFHLRTAQ